jgi:hypothetical protein
VLQQSSGPERKDCAVETVGTARLTRAIPPQRAISASVSRREINAVLDDTDGIPELLLDVISVDRGERGTISMTWSRDELERLLEAASENEVVLTFDEEELTSFLSDVEAHGMRTRAAVFAVAAAGALGTGASIANASIAGGEGGGGTATPITATADAAAAAASQARSEAMNEEYGLGSAGGAGAAAASQARSQAMNEEYGLGSAGGAAAAAASQARSEAMNEEYGLGSAGDAAAVRAVEQRGAAMNEAYGLGVSATDSRVTDASSVGGYAAPVESSGGGVDIQLPPVDDALLIGGLLLTIAGAAFVVRRAATPPLA